ncbi:MAG: hypothetical protein SGJ18_02600 [Pseudomonadota bacterium]|nr:hypothetical protein [Pseudomonadota bacterium]
MNRFLVAIFLGFFCNQASANQELIFEFHIKAGTQSGPWNAPEDMIEAKIGDVVRIFNDDSIDHQLHTGGAPCAHSPVIAPGRSWDCEISNEYNAKSSGALYDHSYGPDAAFWLSASR